MNARIAASVISVVAGAAVWAQEPRVTLSPAALEEIADVEAEIDRIEAQTLERLAAPPDNEVQQIELLGKAMLYDKNLSVNLNEACAFCHMPETGFTGPVSELNRTTAPIPVQCARVLAIANRSHTPMPRFHPFFITIPARAIS